MPSAEDRFKASLTSLIRRTLGAKIIERIDYLALYPCKVVSQNSDGTLELTADDSRVGAPSSVPIRYGVPGTAATVPAGSRCYMSFAGGDPSKPIVVDWESGTVLSLLLGSTSASEALVKGNTFKTLLDAFLLAVSAATTAPQIAAAATTFKNGILATPILSTVVKTT